MTKIKTQRQILREQRKQEVFDEWLKLFKKGHSKTSAFPLLSETFGMSEATISIWIREKEKMNGIRPHAAYKERIMAEACEAFRQMHSVGYTNDEAFHKLGIKYGVNFSTIRSWVMKEKVNQQTARP